MARQITIVLTADTKPFDTAIDGAKRKFNSAIDSNTASVGKLRSAVGGLTSALTALGGALAFREIAELGINLDKARNAMTALTGSVEAANKKLTELRELAKVSPGVTTTFATELFKQLKAIKGITDETINGVIKSLGKLNTVFGDIGPEFSRNLVQIFQQGFERSDIKEALTKLPIFEQLLEQAFGTKDPEKLRKLKDAGKLTLGGFLEGFSNAINTDERFKQAQESLGGRLQKGFDELKIRLAELGEKILQVLLPALEKLNPILKAILDFLIAMPDHLKAVTIGILAVAPAINIVTSAIGGLKGAMVALGAFLGTPTGIAALALVGIATAGLELRDLLKNQIPRNVQQQLNPQDLKRGPGGLGAFALVPSLQGEEIKTLDISGASLGLTLGRKGQIIRGDPAGAKAAAAAKKVADETKATGKARHSRPQLGGFGPDFGLNETELLLHEIELARIRQSNEAVARRRALEQIGTQVGPAIGAENLEILQRAGARPGQLAGFAASNAERLRQIDLETLELEEKTARKAFEELEKTGALLSNSERFMRGFTEATISAGDAFERFGANVADAFLNVRNLFDGLKRSVLGFFNDLLGSALQGIVRQTLGPIFGGIGGALGGGVSAPAAISQRASFFSGAGGLASAFGGGGGGSIFSGGRLSLSGLAPALGAAAPLLGLSLGSGLGGQSKLGQVFGAAGGLIAGGIGAVGLGAITSGPLLGLLVNPFSGPIAAALIVGSILLGKAAQRRKDEAASGQMLTAALAGITQLRDAIGADRVDGGQARSIFENEILGEFIRGVSGLKTESVRKSRLTNQVADLRKVYEDVIPPAIAAQALRRSSSASNALTHSRLIPEFAIGGIAGGGLALLHPNEMVLTVRHQAAIAARTNANIFNDVGVPGVQQNRRFDQGGVFGGGDQPIVIENLSVGFMVGKGDASRAFVLGGSTPRGRSVVVNNIKVARTNREL